MFVVFDLDGTLADDSHRLHHILDPDTPKDWDSYFNECNWDVPIKQTIDFWNDLYKAGVKVPIWTGRSEIVRGKTIQWLCENVNEDFGDDTKFTEIKMRPVNDYCSTNELKGKWLDECYIHPNFVVDDRDFTCEWWRNKGIPCLQAGMVRG